MESKRTPSRKVNGSKKSRKARKPRYLKANELSVRVPRNYPWKVLRSLLQDLKEYLPDQDVKTLQDILRRQSVDDVLDLADQWGPQSIDPCGVDDFISFKVRYLLASVLKKYRFPGSKTDRELAAKKKFYAAEERCARTNTRLAARDFLVQDSDASVWHHAKQFIVKVIGEEPPALDVLTRDSRHGPGVTLDTENGRTHTLFKYSEWPYTCTAAARPLAIALIRQDERWFNSLLTDYCTTAKIRCVEHGSNYAFMDSFSWSDFWTHVIHVVDGNRITFVPKSARTERTIAIEPLLNLMLQLGVDGYVRTNLKRFGVDLDDQRKNQVLARKGSLGDSPESFSTLDLSAASDCIALEAVKSLLPQAWYTLLLNLRCPSGDIKGESLCYNKLSSMGNGFTFAIESLLFSAIVYGVMRSHDPFEKVNWDDFAVFGDDIIVKAKYTARLTICLRKMGFSLNTEKSFTQGPFRESCGADWYQGVNVRPVFLTAVPKSVHELWNDINRLHRVLQLRFGVDWETSATKEAMEQWIPLQFRGYIGPCSNFEFDTYLHSGCKPQGIQYSREKGSFKFQRLSRKPVDVPIRSKVHMTWMRMMHSLRSTPLFNWWDRGFDVSRRSTATLRNAVRYRPGRGYTETWCSLYRDPDLADELPLAPMVPIVQLKLAKLLGYREHLIRDVAMRIL